MAPVNPQLRALVGSASGGGELDGPTVLVGMGQNPVCGDRLRLYVRPSDGVIEALSYRATACAAATAVAELATRHLVGHRLDASALMSELRRVVQDHGGLHAAERHALDLFADALGQLLATR